MCDRHIVTDANAAKPLYITHRMNRYVASETDIFRIVKINVLINGNIITDTGAERF